MKFSPKRLTGKTCEFICTQKGLAGSKPLVWDFIFCHNMCPQLVQCLKCCALLILIFGCRMMCWVVSNVISLCWPVDYFKPDTIYKWILGSWHGETTLKAATQGCGALPEPVQFFFPAMSIVEDWGAAHRRYCASSKHTYISFERRAKTGRVWRSGSSSFATRFWFCLKYLFYLDGGWVAWGRILQIEDMLPDS